MIIAQLVYIASIIQILISTWHWVFDSLDTPMQPDNCFWTDYNYVAMLVINVLNPNTVFPTPYIYKKHGSFNYNNYYYILDPKISQPKT